MFVWSDIDIRMNFRLFSTHTIGSEHQCARPIGLFGCGGLGPLTLTYTITGIHCWPWWRHSLIKSTMEEQYKGQVNFKTSIDFFRLLFFLKKKYSALRSMWNGRWLKNPPWNRYSERSCSRYFRLMCSRHSMILHQLKRTMLILSRINIYWFS